MADILITVLGIICVVFVWVALYDSNRFVVRELKITDRRIRKPFRAVVVADLHNKRYGKENERLLAAIREQKPDLILTAGDIPTAKPGKKLDVAVDFLKKLREEYPVCYANGNHEHRLKLYPEKYGDMAERYAEALADMGIEPLVNGHAELAELGVVVYGAEIAKQYYKRFGKPEMDEAYLRETLGTPDKECYTVLLAHNPEYFQRYAQWGADLTVSGHVHGGIVRVPFWGKGLVSPSLAPFPKYDGGVFREGDSVMLLSRGLGSHTIPVRLFNPGELWVVDFTPELM